MPTALLLDCALKAALLITLAAAADLLLRRASAAARHLAWTLTLIACLALPMTVPLLPAWHILPRLTHQQSISSAMPAPLPAPANMHSLPEPAIARPQHIPATNAEPVLPSPATPPLPLTITSKPATPGTNFPWLATLYCAGAGTFLLLIACDPLIRHRLIKASHPITDPSILAALLSAQHALGIRHQVALRNSTRHAIPLTLGLFRPVILLPAASAQWPQDELRMVLLHELAHIRRRDPLTHLLARLTCAAYFFHPFVWLSARRMAALRERAADDLVLSRGEKPSAYAATLLQFTTLAGRAPIFSPALPISRGNAKGRTFESRLRALLAPGNRRSLSARGALLLAAMILAAIVPIAMLAAQTPTSQTANQATRIRELIYVLRNNVVWSRPEETYAAARELIEIGKPAVPDLCAELKHQPGDQAIRVIAFTLRNIADPRAVPTLIDALADTTMLSSTCGDRLYDKDLWQFVMTHTKDAGDDKFPDFTVHRSDVEIIYALYDITHHSVSDKRFYSPRDGLPEHLQAAKDGRLNDIMLWNQWWDDHSQEFTTREALKEIHPWSEGEDPVAAAGEAKFGPLFPTGKDARLGPVHELFFDQKGDMDSRMSIDFDTGQTFTCAQGMTGAEFAALSYVPWWRKMGIDATVQVNVMNSEGEDPAKPAHFAFDLFGAELRVWQIPNARWDSFPVEVAAAKPIDKGKFAANAQLNNRDTQSNELLAWYLYPRTYFFWTREGGRGILQLVASTENPPGLKIRYRTYEGLPVRKVDLPPAFAPPENLAFAEPVKITLPTPLSGKPSVLDLDTGKLYAIAPHEPVSPELLAAVAAATKPDRPEEVYRPEEEIDQTQQAAAAALRADIAPEPAHNIKLWSLACFDMSVGTVSPDAWDNYSPAQVIETLSRCEPPNPQRGNRGRMQLKDTYNSFPNNTGTYVFQTREGGRGLLQVLSGTDNPQTLTIQYKLIK